MQCFQFACPLRPRLLAFLRCSLAYGLGKPVAVLSVWRRVVETSVQAKCRLTLVKAEFRIRLNPETFWHSLTHPGILSRALRQYAPGPLGLEHLVCSLSWPGVFQRFLN